jgi:cyclopropane-fatty-acyl-phospholipid synthase
MNTAALPNRKSWSSSLLELDLVPDPLIRRGIRRLLRARLAEEDRGDPEGQQRHLMELIGRLKQSPIAINTSEANQQHYELPSGFFELVLGKHLKYSSCYYRTGAESLADAEAHMLALTVERARLRDGDRILELGCGWGSLSLWMAEHLPRSRITAVSNSRSQKLFIDARAAARGLDNLEVVTRDMNQLGFPDEVKFDRVVSVEMFEHMRNYELLMRRIAGWLNPGGTLFVHIFTHKCYAYPFEIRDESDWMARYFFTGGIMPSDDLLLNFQRDVQIEDHWLESGMHYGHTAHAWLENTDAHKAEILELFENTYASSLLKQQRRAEATKWLVRWRVFFMACEELWKYNGGNEWGVSHYTFRKR